MASHTVQGLVDEIGHLAGGLSPEPPAALDAGVSELSAAVARLRRVARAARDLAEDDDEYGAPSDAAELPWTEADFAALTETHRRALLVHCYRMTGSYDDAEDLVRESVLRAWRARDTFPGRAGTVTWLYRIATHVCLEFLRRTPRRPHGHEPLPGVRHGAGEPPARITWLQPYPDDEVPGPAPAAGPYASLELPLLVALQHLPPRQRAALVLRDVLGLSAGDTAEALGLTPGSVDDALERARPALRERLPVRSAHRTGEGTHDDGGDGSGRERAVLLRYMAAGEAADVAAAGRLLAADVTLTMPPEPSWFTGRDAVLAHLRTRLDPLGPAFPGHRRHLPVRANGQPAAGVYVRRPGTNVHRAQLLDVLRVEDDRIVEITSFEPHLFPAFGLPPRL
ncbi:RNA polymerase subunit sigma-70 [Streptomyces sp. NPDC017936]|uniref:RNA polymerase subunit sigma-70 n=1 Tax=Streptomyces sp. NPDC017936 TaxID=3365016 RepID=UPI00379C0BF4